MTLGDKIRRLRLDKKMTLQDVAERTGYSKALISRIENDSVSPSITSLVRISSVFKITLHELFLAAEGGQVSVVKKNSRSSRAFAGGRIKIESLRESAAGSKMGVVIMTLSPGVMREAGEKTDVAETWCYVFKGKLEAHTGGQTYELTEGDSIYLTSDVPHKWCNPSKGKASALIVETPPSS